jgi:heme/copper-type cytochrome/quinol oxidase subunit 2
MKYLIICIILFLATFSTLQTHAFQHGKKPAEIDFAKLDALEAMAIANAWKWSQKDVKSFVTAREVVFKFSDGKEQKVPLPQEKMLVAVAPFLRKTHK